MYRMIMHLTHEFETLTQCESMYELIKKDLKQHPALHINGQVTTKFTPSHLEGTPEKGPPS